MAGAGLLHRPVDRLQRLPAPLRQDRGEPEFAGHPGRHFAAGPQAPIGRRLGQARTQPLEKRGPEHARHAPVAPAQVAQGLGPVRVVAGEQLLNPPSPEARHRRDIRDGVTPRQQPDHLKVPRRGRILGRPEPRFQIVHAQMISNPRHGSPPRLMAHQPTRCSTTQESSIRVHRPEPVSVLRCRPSRSDSIQLQTPLGVHPRRDLRKRRVGLRAEARRTWPWWRTAVDPSALAQSRESGGMKNWRASEELIKELRSLYQGLPMARQALDKGDITGAKEILREMDRYLQDVLWTTVTMPQDPGGAPASDAVTRPKAERQRPAKAR